MAVVVDTNVAIVANGRKGETNADADCQLSCVEMLRSVVAEEVVAIDDRRVILQEYRNRLDFSGRPGVGDFFFKHVWDHQYQDGRVQQVVVTPCDDDSRASRSCRKMPSTAPTESSLPSRLSQTLSF